jgi:DNA-binding HxlR family transcriptional regulator
MYDSGVALFEYPQFCPVSRAAEILGERWTLLLARELCLGPQRFSDLRHRLRPISSSVLTKRLAALEQRGLIAQRKLPPPAASVVYELTETGKTLRPVLQELARFGARFLFPERGEGEYSNPEWSLLAPASFARRGASPPWRFALEVRHGDALHHFHIEGGEAGTRVREEALAAETTLRFELPLLVPLIAGFTDLEEALQSGALAVEGDRSALSHFSGLFEMDFGDAAPPVSGGPLPPSPRGT